jgi:thiamine monophosphate kinase
MVSFKTTLHRAIEESDAVTVGRSNYLAVRTDVVVRTRHLPAVTSQRLMPTGGGGQA